MIPMDATTVLEIPEFYLDGEPVELGAYDYERGTYEVREADGTTTYVVPNQITVK